MDRLVQYLKQNHLTQAEFARLVGVTQATVSRICLGQAKPSLNLAIRIRNASGGAIRPEDWVSSAPAHEHDRSTAC